MHAYLMTSFVIGVIANIVRLATLANANYPRIVKWTRAQDVAGLVVSLGFMLWAAWLLLKN